MASGSKKVNNAAEIDRLALALTKEPRSKAFIPLAEEYGKAAMWEEAAAVLEDGLKIYPGFITAMVALGRAYEQINQPVKAQAILEEAIKLSPDNLRAHRTLAKLYAAHGARHEAMKSCNVILASNPQDQEALTLRAGLETSPVQGSTGEGGEVQKKSTVVRGNESANGRAPLNSSVDGIELGRVSKAGALPSHQAVRGEHLASPAGNTGPGGVGAPRGQASVVHKLEQWLNSVQKRRRDPHNFSRPNPSTSL